MPPLIHISGSAPDDDDNDDDDDDDVRLSVRRRRVDRDAAL